MTSSHPKTYHYLALALVCLLALGVRLGAAKHFQSKLAAGAQFEFGDSETYWKLGEAIYQGTDYSYGPRDYRVMRTPGYPILLSMLMRATGGAATAWEARLLSVVLGVAGLLMTYATARWMFDSQVGLMTAAIAALAPCAVASSVFVLAEAPFIPVMLGQLASWWGWMTTDSPRRALFLATLCGVLAGLGVLIRPSWLLFTPVALVAMLLIRRKNPNFRALQFAPTVVCLVFLTAVMGLWWARNYQVSNRFIATTLQAGPSLYDGWRPDAEGSSDMRFVEDFEARADEDATIPKKGVEREIILDKQMSAAAWDWAKQNPARVVQLAAIKFLRTWNVVPNFAEMQSPTLRAAVFLGYTPIIVTALLGAWGYRKRPEILLVCLLPAIYFSLLHLIYVGSIRYRQPAMFPLFVLSAAWITDCLTRLRSTSGGQQGRGVAG